MTRSTTGKGSVVLGKAKLESRGRSDMMRGQPRRKLRLATTALQGDGASNVEVLNISMVGILLRTEGELAVDEPLMVVLPNAGERAARVVWSADKVFGCRFIEPLSRADFSAALLKGIPFEDPDSQPAADEDGSESFGQRVRRMRMETHHSMVELASLVGVTKPTLWKWETDQVRPRRAALGRLASVFGMSEPELLFGRRRVAAMPVLPEEGVTLAELIADCRERIAQKAGVEVERVTIAIDWN